MNPLDDLKAKLAEAMKLLEYFKDPQNQKVAKARGMGSKVSSLQSGFARVAAKVQEITNAGSFSDAWKILTGRGEQAGLGFIPLIVGGAVLGAGVMVTDWITDAQETKAQLEREKLAYAKELTAAGKSSEARAVLGTMGDSPLVNIKGLGLLAGTILAVKYGPDLMKKFQRKRAA